MKNLFLIIFLFTCSYAYSYEVTFLLIRHGETDWNVERRAQGHLDIPLNKNGKQQAETIANKLYKEYPQIDAIYSSDLSRAYCTANETAKKFNLFVEMRRSLREIDVGSTEGMLAAEREALYNGKWAELVKLYPNERDRWNYTPVPGQETIANLIHRVKSELLEIAEEHRGQTIAIFTHSIVIRTFVADMDHNKLGHTQVPNGGIVEIIYNSENLLHPFKLIKVDFLQ